jgi:hypothetical protein
MQLPVNNEIALRSKARGAGRAAGAHGRAVGIAMASRRDISGRHIGQFLFWHSTTPGTVLPTTAGPFHFYHEQMS